MVFFTGYCTARAGHKPFNPLLGETFECIRDDKGFKYIAEQVNNLEGFFFVILANFGHFLTLLAIYVQLEQGINLSILDSAKLFKCMIVLSYLRHGLLVTSTSEKQQQRQESAGTLNTY